ncbi:MAG: hypothetical protein AAFY41_09315 [Bacteroidota bacterium]
MNKLVLNPPKDFKNDIKTIANQILSRQKLIGKLDSWSTNFDLIMPPPLSVEQASSEATSNYKSQHLSGEYLVDLTGGMGIDCLKLGQNFEKITYVEKEESLCEVFKHNSNELGKQVEVYNQDAEGFIKKFQGNPETVFYLDPARRDHVQNRVFKIQDCSPDFVEILPELKKKGKIVLMKLSPLLDLSNIQSSIENVKVIHILSVKNECKEILLEIDFEFEGDIKIVCVNLDTRQPVYSYLWKDEINATAASGKVSSYIYEPNSSIMKAGAFKKITVDFPLRKIAPNTHLYTANSVSAGFPGRIFKVKSIVDKRGLKELKGKTINVITRNYPFNANELKKQWKIKDGGKEFLIAFRDQQDKARVIITERQHSSG